MPADFPSAITYHACVHCNAAISPLQTWQPDRYITCSARHVNVCG